MGEADVFQNAAEMTPFGRKVSLFHSEKSWKILKKL